MNDEIDRSKLTVPSTLRFYNLPQANWRIYFGDSTDTYFQFYIKNPPNRFQRWMIKKIFGVTWKPVND
jgi:hypothetical protein